MPLPGLRTPALFTSPLGRLGPKRRRKPTKESGRTYASTVLAERGDQVFSVSVEGAIARQAAAGMEPPDPAKASDATRGARVLGSTPWRIQQMSAAPDGRRLAFVTVAVSERSEKVEESEIYSLDLTAASPDRPPRQVTHNEALNRPSTGAAIAAIFCSRWTMVRWKGKYQDTQTRLYWVDADSGDVQRWAAEFSRASRSLCSCV